MIQKSIKSGRAALFDIDGTLLDSTSLWAEIPEEYLRRQGIPHREDLYEVFVNRGYGDTARYIVEKYQPDREPYAVMDSFCEIAAEKYRLGLEEKPFATAYLRHLHGAGIPCIALTSNIRKVVLPALTALGMTDYLDDVVSIHDIGLDKRTPELYHVIAGLLKVPERECVVFEDTLFAAESARQAGMRVVGVYDEMSRSHWDELRRVASRAVHGFDELLDNDIFPAEPVLSAARAGTV